MIGSIAQLPDAAHKDAHPLETVKKIKGILQEHGIMTEEIWTESNVPYCYSLRINILGTTIGTNGKGVTREFALASGYGELCERLQLGMIWKNKLAVEGGASSCEAQSISLSAEELLRRNFKWYTSYARELKRHTGVSMSEEKILGQYTDSSGQVQATPYYCLTTHTREYLPTPMCKALYGTNGAAAGNTMEEAIVQAISEIVERHYKLKVISEDIAVPEIPEEVLKSWPIAYEIIEFLRSNGFRVMVKDCSLGSKFPVVCVCMVDTRTGKYHTHFGAYPDFEIALQRTLTESFQGRNIGNIAKYEDFSYESKNALAMEHLVPELVHGTSEKTPQFFFRSSQEPYRQTAGFSGKTNRERLKECAAFFREQELDVLVRDCSCLGFPSCQVIIPGYSESVPHRLASKFNDTRYSAYSSRVLRNPAAANPEDFVGLLMHIMQRTTLKIPVMDSFCKETGIPAQISTNDEAYLMNVSLAYAYYALGKYKETINLIGKAINTGNAEHKERLICVKRYIALKQGQQTAEDIRATLEHFHKPETVAALYHDLDQYKNPLYSFVLRCDMQCTPDCMLISQCKRQQTNEIMRLIFGRSKEMDQSAVENLLKEI